MKEGEMTFLTTKSIHSFFLFKSPAEPSLRVLTYEQNAHTMTTF
jgi:hypothetical protein